MNWLITSIFSYTNVSRLGSGAGCGCGCIPAIRGGASLLLSMIMMAKLASGTATATAAGTDVPMLRGYLRPLRNSTVDYLDIDFISNSYFPQQFLTINRTGTHADFPFTLPNSTKVLPNTNEVSVDEIHLFTPTLT